MTRSEYEALSALGGRTPKGILNTKGPAYRSLKAKPQTDDEALNVLVENPRLMIRPALAGVGAARFGFDEDGFHNLVNG